MCVVVVVAVCCGYCSVVDVLVVVIPVVHVSVVYNPLCGGRGVVVFPVVVGIVVDIIVG